MQQLNEQLLPSIIQSNKNLLRGLSNGPYKNLVTKKINTLIRVSKKIPETKRDARILDQKARIHKMKVLTVPGYSLSDKYKEYHKTISQYADKYFNSVNPTHKTFESALEDLHKQREEDINYLKTKCPKLFSQNLSGKKQEYFAV